MLLLHQKKDEMKKKITFSHSGGTPAMAFINNLKESFGSNDLDFIASKIASTCMNTEIRIEYKYMDGTLGIVGSNALCIRTNGNTLVFKAENIVVTEKTLTFK